MQALVELTEAVNAQHGTQIVCHASGLVCVLRSSFVSMSVHWKQPIYNYVGGDGAQRARKFDEDIRTMSAAAAPVPFDRSKRFKVERLMRPEYARNEHQIDIDSNLTQEEVLDPRRWKDLASKFRVGDEIVVRKEDCTLHARLFVIGINPATGDVDLGVIHWKEFSQTALSSTWSDGRFSAMQSRPGKYKIIRNSDTRLMADDIDTLAAAIQRITTDFKNASVA
ncbi:MAG: hypothetical protein WB662_14115 [Methyloceanibacter sp.]